MTSLETILKSEPARDRWGRYLVRLPGDAKAKGRTRVTTFIKALDQGDGLIAWKATATMVGALRNPGLMAKWAAVYAQSTDPWYASDDLKTKCKKLVDECADHGGAQSRASLGTALHTMVELVARGESPELVSPYREDVEAWSATLAAAFINPLKDWTEVCVYIEAYDLVGTFDGLFNDWTTNTKILGDLKTETSTDYKALNHAAQLAAYSLATHRIIFPANPEDECTLEPLPDFDRETGLIVHLPAGEARCHLHAVDLAQGREALEVAATMRRLDAQRKRKDTGGLMRPWASAVITDLLAASLPAENNDITEASCPGSSNETTAASGTTAASMVNDTAPFPTLSPSGSVNPPGTSGSTTIPTESSTKTNCEACSTTPSTAEASTPQPATKTDGPAQADIKARLAELRAGDSPLMSAIRRDWPIAKKLNEDWDDQETRRVAALLARLDVEGELVDTVEADRVRSLYPTLTEPQAARVVAWITEAANTPGGRSLSLGGGMHTTRRIALAEALVALAASEVGDTDLYGFLVEVMVGNPQRDTPITELGSAFAWMNWREALTLRDVVLAHTRLGAEAPSTRSAATNQPARRGDGLTKCLARHATGCTPSCSTHQTTTRSHHGNLTGTGP